ncbi:hypothetical protein DLAC_04367 [Tieghemostelium lacteum]|uniref:Uncharacterized protein n=1 Tax=Tieghemostelium lacteum TaxID=361077 RepID=A0A151ZJI5_TIELA|nr:hypothetical protein DLAC_04367 [Tieghemostelium lacteum]|eukprot:KYQ94087.1 hypothetical protein DLAC_04367 [Tieghemostelium lacteum]
MLIQEIDCLFRDRITSAKCFYPLNDLRNIKKVDFNLSPDIGGDLIIIDPVNIEYHLTVNVQRYGGDGNVRYLDKKLSDLILSFRVFRSLTLASVIINYRVVTNMQSLLKKIEFHKVSIQFNTLCSLISRSPQMEVLILIDTSTPIPELLFDSIIKISNQHKNLNDCTIKFKNDNRTILNFTSILNLLNNIHCKRVKLNYSLANDVTDSQISIVNPSIEIFDFNVTSYANHNLFSIWKDKSQLKDIVLNLDENDITSVNQMKNLERLHNTTYIMSLKENHLHLPSLKEIQISKSNINMINCLLSNNSQLASIDMGSLSLDDLIIVLNSQYPTLTKLSISSVTGKSLTDIDEQSLLQSFQHNTTISMLKIGYLQLEFHHSILFLFSILKVNRSLITLFLKLCVFMPPDIKSTDQLSPDKVLHDNNTIEKLYIPSFYLSRVPQYNSMEKFDNLLNKYSIIRLKDDFTW